MTFEELLASGLRKIVGKKVNVRGRSNCVRIVLTEYRVHYGPVLEVASDNFTMQVSCSCGSKESIVIKMNQVSSFSIS